MSLTPEKIIEWNRKANGWQELREFFERIDGGKPSLESREAGRHERRYRLGVVKYLTYNQKQRDEHDHQHSAGEGAP